MLFILTGDVQTGKTRWIGRTIDELIEHGVEVIGMTAPGVWVESDSMRADANGFEKLAIDNVLHPNGKRIRFADRADIAKASGTFDANSQAGKAGLGWHIYEDALEEVNAHLASLPSSCDDSCRRLLVIDELGRLELMHGKGLVEALRILDEGPDECTKDTLVVVRDALVDEAIVRIGGAWGETKLLAPDDESREFLEDHLNIART